MEDKELLIKKYTNRRLYDTEKSIYVSLDHITHLIRQGRKIKVIDAKTKEDVTSAVLTQIILEDARKKKYLLPASLLHLIIQYGDNVLTDFFEKYLEQTIRNYLAFRDIAEDQFKKWLNYVGINSQLNPKAMPDLASFQKIFDLFSPAQPKQKDGQ
jgi:polyhydroxyalkanoate synthesis repressor PhaR